MDIIYIIIGMGLFALSFILIELCDRLNGGKS